MGSFASYIWHEIFPPGSSLDSETGWTGELSLRLISSIGKTKKITFFFSEKKKKKYFQNNADFFWNFVFFLQISPLRIGLNWRALVLNGVSLILRNKKYFFLNLELVDKKFFFLFFFLHFLMFCGFKKKYLWFMNFFYPFWIFFWNLRFFLELLLFCLDF